MTHKHGKLYKQKMKGAYLGESSFRGGKNFCSREGFNMMFRYLYLTVITIQILNVRLVYQM